ncbi:MAG: hypothetical protein Q7S92_07245 [Candidatus Diapherotrites archaeon]|nr:hypothetical protein [Candidatus Diapherotrites archaeon]
MQAKPLSKSKRLIRKIIPRKPLAHIRLSLIQSRMGRELQLLHLSINGAFVEKYKRSVNPMSTIEKFEHFRTQLHAMKQRLDSPLLRNNPELKERYREAKGAFGFTFGLRMSNVDGIINGTIKHAMSSEVLRTVPEQVAAGRTEVDRTLRELKERRKK